MCVIFSTSLIGDLDNIDPVEAQLLCYQNFLTCFLLLIYTLTKIILWLQIGQCLAIWWRPNFDVVMYPYCSPHITKPKVIFQDHVIGCLLFCLMFWSMITNMWLIYAGVQKAFPCSFIWKGILCSAQKFRSYCGSIAWTLWQCWGMVIMNDSLLILFFYSLSILLY